MAIAAALCSAAAAHAGAGPCAADRVQARWPGGSAEFRVELADDPSERSRGLMFREELAPMSGMLFVYEDAARRAFWMKNTLIPLDMIFADAAGRVVKVHPEAIPHDETPVPSGQPAQFVLEIAGGLAERLGLVAGAELRHPAIPSDIAAWPCE